MRSTFSARLTSLLLAAGTACGTAHAAEIDVIGLFPGKAVLVVNGAAPKTYSIGSSIEPGIKLVDVTSETATIDFRGKRQTVPLGAHINRTVSASGPASVILHPDSRGHYMADGQINGGSVRMLVDTGASLISLPATDAMRLGINYKNGQRGYSQTANGVKPVYKVTLNSVQIGDIVLNQVDASVHESGLPIILLGMSFLNRTDMKREGETLTLIKRF